MGDGAVHERIADGYPRELLARAAAALAEIHGRKEAARIIFDAAIALGRGPSPRDTLWAILMETASDYDMRPEELLDRTNMWGVSHPRQDFMWRARQVKWAHGGFRFSSPAIARFLGLNDHTTILHGAKAHASRLASKTAGASA